VAQSPSGDHCCDSIEIESELRRNWQEIAGAPVRGQNMKIVAVLIAVILSIFIVGLFAYVLYLSEGAERKRR
jgi:hypothetical protein